MSSGEWLELGVGEALTGVAAIVVADDCEAAARMIGAAKARGFPGASDRAIQDRIERDFIAPVRDRCDPSAWERAFDDGRAFSDEQAISYALSQLASVAPKPPTLRRASSRTGAEAERRPSLWPSRRVEAP